MERIDRIRKRIEQTATEAHAYAPITRVISEAEVKEILEQEEKPKTNAERIRSMTDEELADWLHNMCCFEKGEEPYMSIYSLDAEHEKEIHDSYGDLLEWLKAESE